MTDPLRARNRLGVVFFPAFDWAISATHPEREERLLYTRDQLAEEGLFDIPGITEYRPELATDAQVERVHFCLPSTGAVVTDSHRASAGGAITAARLVMEKKEDKAFALVRPPGHHAMRVTHGNRGFCNINNEAVMVEYIRDHYPHPTGRPLRIAIVDTDVHHGDGSQDIFWNDPHTLFISLHQDGRTLYPGTGFPQECGGPGALGRTINIPLPPETSDEGYLYAIEHAVLPMLADFKPDLVINSAGQDNHFTDPLANMKLSAQGYAALNRALDPDIAVLEGGYAIRGALPYVNLGICLALAGLDAGRYDIMVNGVDITPERAEKYDFSTPYAFNRPVGAPRPPARNRRSATTSPASATACWSSTTTRRPCRRKARKSTAGGRGASMSSTIRTCCARASARAGACARTAPAWAASRQAPSAWPAPCACSSPATPAPAAAPRPRPAPRRPARPVSTPMCWCWTVTPR